MPWDLVHNHPACRAGEWAVVNRQAEEEGRHSIEGCHGTRDEALAQQRALYANEPKDHEVQTMEHKSFTAPAEWKAVNGDPGTLEGYLSVFDNVDLGGDVVLRGAFQKTLEYWARRKQRIPLLVDHKMSTEGVVGSIPFAQEDQVGLRVRAQFSSITKAQDIRTLMLEGHLNGMSFTYEPIRSRPGVKDGKRVRFLEELRLFEGTITPFPMNTDAVSVAVKATVPHGLDLGVFMDAARRAAALPDLAYKAAMAVLLDAYQPSDETPDPAVEPADEPEPTADAHADPEPVGPAEAADAYARRFITTPGSRDGAPNGDTPSKALADPRIPLEIARQNAEADRLEREINAALGRAAG